MLHLIILGSIMVDKTRMQHSGRSIHHSSQIRIMLSIRSWVGLNRHKARYRRARFCRIGLGTGEVPTI
jgi:hypothetical protein